MYNNNSKCRIDKLGNIFLAKEIPCGGFAYTTCQGKNWREIFYVLKLNKSNNLFICSIKLSGKSKIKTN